MEKMQRDLARAIGEFYEKRGAFGEICLHRSTLQHELIRANSVSLPDAVHKSIAGDAGNLSGELGR